MLCIPGPPVSVLLRQGYSLLKPGTLPVFLVQVFPEFLENDVCVLIKPFPRPGGPSRTPLVQTSGKHLDLGRGPSGHCPGLSKTRDPPELHPIRYV